MKHCGETSRCSNTDKINLLEPEVKKNIRHYHFRDHYLNFSLLIWPHIYWLKENFEQNVSKIEIEIIKVSEREWAEGPLARFGRVASKTRLPYSNVPGHLFPK